MLYDSRELYRGSWQPEHNHANLRKRVALEKIYDQDQFGRPKSDNVLGAHGTGRLHIGAERLPIHGRGQNPCDFHASRPGRTTEHVRRHACP